MPRTLVLVTGLAWLVGCAALFERPAPEAERRAYALAERAEQASQQQGRSAFEDFLTRYPTSVLAPDAELALAGIAQRGGEHADARRRYAALVESGGPASDRARVRLALLELEAGDSAAARRWVERVRLSRLEGAEKRNALRALAESAPGPAQRVRWLALLRAEVPEGESVDALDGEIDAQIAQLSASELEDAARLVGKRPPAGRIFLLLSEQMLAEGDFDAAQRALDAASRRPIAQRYAPRLVALQQRLAQREAGPTEVADLPTFEQLSQRPQPAVSDAVGTLGVVLPLSGPFARFGEEALHGVLLAAEVFPDATDGARPRMQVVVRDSRGDPRVGAAAVRELASDRDVVAIVGALVPSASEATADEAESRGVPLLALSARESLAADRSWVFRLRTRPVEEAELLADRARALGVERFGILYRDDSYGRGLSGLFWDAVESRGGQVVAVASYDPKATDFGDSIRRLVGYTLLDREENALLAKRKQMLRRARRLPDDEARKLRFEARRLVTRDGGPIPPIVDFDALFVPESRENLVLIAPQLAFHEVTGTRLLGSEGGFDDDLVRLAGDHLSGALFAAHFYADSPVPYVRAFRQEYERVYGSTPDVFSASGYDAARLAMLQLARGHDDRDELRDGLLRTSGYPGVSGVLTMRSDGNAQKRPYLLGIERGRVEHHLD